MKKALVCLVAAFLLASSLIAQTPLKRIRLGNIVESIAYVSKGSDAGTIAILDGMQVTGFPADARGNAPIRTLFDFSKLGFTAQPTGMGYDSDDKLFVFTVNTQNSPTVTLYLADSKGNPAGTVVANWPEELAANNPYVEGIAWIPYGASRYPGCFVLTAIEQFGDTNSYLVVDRSGQVVANIVPNLGAALPFFFPTGLAYHDGELLVGDVNGNLYEMDLDGNILAGPIQFQDAADLEGVAYAEHSDRIVLTSASNAKLIFLDSSLQRLPDERSFRVGFGLSHVLDVSWSSSTSEFLLNDNAIEPALDLPQVAAVTADFLSSRKVISTAGSAVIHLEYLPDTDEIALFNRSFPRQYIFSDLNGNQTGTTAVPNSQVPGTFTYIPTTHQFAIRRTSPANAITIYDRANLAGPPVRTISLAPLGITTYADVSFMHPDDPSGGQFLVTTVNEFYVVDFNGTLLAQYPNTLRVSSVGAISSGPYAGDFAGIYAPNDDLVIFSLP